MHSSGKTYLATANNIEKDASERFFADGTPPAGLPQLASSAQALAEEPLPLNTMSILTDLKSQIDLCSECGDKFADTT